MFKHHSQQKQAVVEEYDDVSDDPVPSIMPGGLFNFDNLIKQTPLLVSKGSTTKQMCLQLPGIHDLITKSNSREDLSSIMSSKDESSVPLYERTNVKRKTDPKANTIRKNLMKVI